MINPASVKVVSAGGAKITFGICPAADNCTMTVLAMPENKPLVMVDMSQDDLIALAANIVKAAAQLSAATARKH